MHMDGVMKEAIMGDLETGSRIFIGGKRMEIAWTLMC